MENNSLVPINKSEKNNFIEFIKENKYYIAGLLIIVGGASYYFCIIKK